MAYLSSERITIIKTFNAYYSFFVLGLCNTVLGPTLLDLMFVANTDLKNISLLFTSKAIAGLCGSLISGIAFDVISKRHAILTIITLITSLSMFAIPWSRSLTVVISLNAVLGLSTGALAPGANVCIIDLWGVKSKPFLQALHFSYSAGSLIAPLIAAPFVQIHENSTAAADSSFVFATQFNVEEFTEIVETSDSIPKVTYAFVIIGILSVTNMLGFLFVSFISPTDVNNQKGETETSDKTNLKFTLILVFIVSVFMAAAIGAEFGYTQMLTTYATKSSLKLPVTTGSYMTSAFYVALTFARLIAIPLTIKFNSFTLIVTNILLTIVGITLLYFVGAHHEWGLWLSSVLLGAGISCLIPASYSLIEKHIVITNKIAAAFEIGSSIAAMLVPYLIGQYIEENTNVFIYSILLNWILLVIMTLILFILLKTASSKYTSKSDVEISNLDSEYNSKM